MRSTPSGIKFAVADETMLGSRPIIERARQRHGARTIAGRGSASRLRDKTGADSPQSESPRRNRGLWPDLLWVRADLKRFGIGTRELVHRGLEFRALAIGIA